LRFSYEEYIRRVLKLAGLKNLTAKEVKKYESWITIPIPIEKIDYKSLRRINPETVRVAVPERLRVIRGVALKN